jgi:hypothetical protein
VPYDPLAPIPYSSARDSFPLLKVPHPLYALLQKLYLRIRENGTPIRTDNLRDFIGGLESRLNRAMRASISARRCIWCPDRFACHFSVLGSYAFPWPPVPAAIGRSSGECFPSSLYSAGEGTTLPPLACYGRVPLPTAVSPTRAEPAWCPYPAAGASARQCQTAE